MDNVINYQLDPIGAAQPQTQTGNEGSADVNVTGGVVGIDQSVPGNTNAMALVPTVVQATAPVIASSTIYENSRIIKLGAGNLYSLDGYNSKGSAQFIQLFDSATV